MIGEIVKYSHNDITCVGEIVDKIKMWEMGSNSITNVTGYLIKENETRKLHSVKHSKLIELC
ncbi:MAG: hypothetical protein WC979_03160 [Candidatus Pacearchaeota archaeon]|jgi:hypothetical protein|nr:hypothetical protein [Clostridia bacterium]